MMKESGLNGKLADVKFVGIINLALVGVYAIGSGLWVNTGDGWYRSLKAPSWQPPDWVFGTIWPYNFIVLGIIGWQIAQRSQRAGIIWGIIFALSILSALTWAYQFYVPHNLLLASIALAAAAIFTIPLLVNAFATVGMLAIILIPYQVWVALASYLSYSYYRLNG